MNFLERDYFEALTKKSLSLLKSGEHLFISLYAESTQFIRINDAKTRQIGTVEDATLEFSIVIEGPSGERRKSQRSLTLTGLLLEDYERIENAIKKLQSETRDLPIDPFAELPKKLESSQTERKGQLLDASESVQQILKLVQGVDLAGIYASGPVVRAMANSQGLSHWFYSESFGIDYSLYTADKGAVKGSYAGSRWDNQAFSKTIDDSKSKLSYLVLPKKTLARGNYRAYLAPAAVQNLIAMFGWHGASEASIRQGESLLRHARSGEKTFSPLFSFSEDFKLGGSPRFNSEGELAPEELPIIESGKLKNTLISTRTAQEYGLTSNHASTDESLRAPCMSPGTKSETQALAHLGTGLYLSNLHYLNWSDSQSGRVTGMTRYACFWVEKGKIIAPIENMRFDDSLYRIFGSSLDAVTRERSLIPSTSTYVRREIGESQIPGVWLTEMSFAL